MASHKLASALILLWAGGFGAPAGAHEFWLVPQVFAPAVGERVGLRLFVGDGASTRGRSACRSTP